MHSTLQAALWLAAKGLRVFPIRANTKDQPLVNFTEAASSDPTIIRAWWIDQTGTVEHAHNIGVASTGSVIADIDTKHGKPGLENFLRLGLSLDTFVVRTPSGGFHAYYQGLDRLVGQSPVAEGIDIRSHNGYVVGPGSVIDGVPYVVEVDAPIAPCPDDLRPLLRAPMERAAASAAFVDLDRPDSIERATLWLREHAPATEGAGGDDHTIRTAMRLKDMGLSDEMALGLLLEEWNPRCLPPWPFDELHRKVENAYAYGKNAIGSDHPALTFSGVSVPDIPVLPSFPAGAFMFGPPRDVMAIPPRDWIYDRILLRRYVTTLVAPGGASKSTHVLTMAAFAANGMAYAGLKLRPSKSIIYNAEDDLDEQERRLHAICRHYSFDPVTTWSRVKLLSSETLPFKLTNGAEPMIAKDHIQALVDVAKREGDLGMIALDPLVELHDCDENDNVKMKYVVGCARVLARQADVGVMLVHHTKKPGAGGSVAGDIDSARGAGSITNAARIGLTLVGMSERDGEEYGIPEDNRNEYVRLDDAKMNLTLKSNQPTWFKKIGVRLGNGDMVGVVEHTDMQVNADFARRQMAEVMVMLLNTQAAGKLTITEAIGGLQANDPMYMHLAMATVKERILKFLRVGVEVDGNRIGIAYETHSGRSTPIITLL